MICVNCGNIITDDMIKCPICGTFFEDRFLSQIDIGVKKEDDNIENDNIENNITEEEIKNNLDLFEEIYNKYIEKENLKPELLQVEEEIIQEEKPQIEEEILEEKKVVEVEQLDINLDNEFLAGVEPVTIKLKKNYLKEFSTILKSFLILISSFLNDKLFKPIKKALINLVKNIKEKNKSAILDIIIILLAIFTVILLYITFFR